MRTRIARALAASLPAVLLAVCLGGCAGSPISLHRRNETLWATGSAEFTAVAMQTYAVAQEKLAQALEDPDWTACIEQQAGYEDLPPAIIVDLDETILDNRPFQLRLIHEDIDFDEKLWNEWVHTAQVEAIPGALDFLLYAEGVGVEIFYVTNRVHSVEAPTRRNLEALGLSLNPEVDTVLTKQERTNWDRDKTSRRVLIAGSYRVLLIVGDNLSDFVQPVGATRERRRATAMEHRAMWGEKWLMLPNPLYGGWVAPTLKGAGS
jgi:5'-nucleotidase (lipoprotein e(P4) family)